MLRFVVHGVLYVSLVFLGGSHPPPTEATPSPAAAWQRLKDGNARFADEKPAPKDLGRKRREELAQGQRPFAVVLMCSDSRIAPELIFDQGLGELFVVRVGANIVDPAVIGSIEYAVAHLQAPLVAVIGHENCGGIHAALDGEQHPGAVGWLVKRIHVGTDLPADKRQAIAAGVRNNALYQAETLTRRSTLLRDFASSKRVQVVAGVYSMTTGKVEWLDMPGATGR
jgi:carbonic anhydrase